MRNFVQLVLSPIHDHFHIRHVIINTLYVLWEYVIIEWRLIDWWIFLTDRVFMKYFNIFTHLIKDHSRVCPCIIDANKTVMIIYQTGTHVQLSCYAQLNGHTNLSGYFLFLAFERHLREINSHVHQWIKLTELRQAPLAEDLLKNTLIWRLADPEAFYQTDLD